MASAANTIVCSELIRCGTIELSSGGVFGVLWTRSCNCGRNKSFEEILSGALDDLPEQAFHLVGNIEGAKAKAKKLAES